MKIFYILLLSIIFIAGCNSIREVCVNQKCFKVEIADTSEKRQIGLMQHEVLKEDNGMWFIFNEEGRHSIWMKNMNFPIDIIWIDSNYNVVDVKRNAEPCTDNCEIYSPSKDAKYVLEVNIDSKINIGDKVEIK